MLTRAGHTEAAVDLTRMAGLGGVRVVGEIIADDGSMGSGDDLLGFAAQHDLPVLASADLIRYRRATERLVEPVATAAMPTEFGAFRTVAYRNTLDGIEHLALVMGDVAPAGRSDRGVRPRAWPGGQRRSMMVTLAWPPPSHIVCSPSAAGARELVQQRRHQPRAGGAERVTQRDDATVDVHLGEVHAGLLLPGQQHRGERLIDLDQIDVVEVGPARSSASAVAGIGAVSIQTGSAPAPRDARSGPGA